MEIGDLVDIFLVAQGFIFGLLLKLKKYGFSEGPKLLNVFSGLVFFELQHMFMNILHKTRNPQLHRIQEINKHYYVPNVSMLCSVGTAK